MQISAPQDQYTAYWVLGAGVKRSTTASWYHRLGRVPSEGSCPCMHGGEENPEQNISQAFHE